MLCLFFVKQKTAYEMRISDWSSDVCSSDLLLKHLVRHGERFLEGRVRVGDQKEILVGNDDQRVDMLLQLGDAGVRRSHTALALEGEGLGHDADGQDATVARRLGDHRRRAGADRKSTRLNSSH